MGSLDLGIGMSGLFGRPKVSFPRPGDPYQGPPGKWGPKGASELVYLPVVEGC